MRALLLVLGIVLVAFVVLWPRGSGSESNASVPSHVSPTAGEDAKTGSSPADAVSTPKKPAASVVNWSCFRGPKHGLSLWDRAPVSWDGPSGKGILWKTPLKVAGVSSPVLWGDRLFITEGDDNERAVLAFDANTGKQLWRQTVPDGGKGEPMPTVSDVGLALPSPVCDADGVYVLFGTGDLAAFTHDGKPKWQIFLKRPVIGYGYSSSPCLFGNLVCVQIDDHMAGRMVAVEAASGKTKWSLERSRGASWSSPIVIPGADGKPVIVANANGSVTAFDEEGKVVWDVDGVTGEVTPTPVWWEGRIYPVHVNSALLCFDVSKKTADPPKLWEYRGNLCDVASPVVVNGLLFMAKGSMGMLVCVDATTGKEVWSHEGPGCYASLVSCGGNIYSLGRDGTMLIVAAEPSYRPIATCKLGDGPDATPAFGDGRP